MHVLRVNLDARIWQLFDVYHASLSRRARDSHRKPPSREELVGAILTFFLSALRDEIIANHEDVPIEAFQQFLESYDGRRFMAAEDPGAHLPDDPDGDGVDAEPPAAPPGKKAPRPF